MIRADILAVAGTALLLAGCVSDNESPPEAAPPIAMCQVPSRSAVGQPYSEALAGKLRQEANARQVRRLGPDTITTKEFLADRLNIVVDARNTITDLRCG